MHRRLWLLAGAAAAVLLVAASATATTKVAGSARGCRSRPQRRLPRRGRRCRGRRPAARPSPSSSSAWSRTSTGSTRSLPAATSSGRLHGRRRSAARRVHPEPEGRLGQGSRRRRRRRRRRRSRTRSSPNANWYWGGKKMPVTYKDFVYTLQKIDDPNNDSSRAGPATATSTRRTSRTRARSRSRSTGRRRTARPTSLAARTRTGRASSPVSIRAAALAGQDFNKIWTNCICGSDGKPVSRRPVLPLELHEGPGHDAEGEPVLGRQEAGPRGGRLQDHHRHEHRGAGHARRRGRRDHADVRPQPAAAQGHARDHVQPDPRLLLRAPRIREGEGHARTRCSARRGCARRSRWASTASRSSTRSTARSPATRSR